MNGGEKGKGKSKATAIEVADSDTEDGSPTVSMPKEVAQVETTSNKGNAVNNDTLAALVGDRAQMEKERLERQRKRQRESGLEEDEDFIQLSVHKKAVTASIQEASARFRVSTIHAPTSTSASTSKAKASGAPFYYSGTIKVRVSGDWGNYWDDVAKVVTVQTDRNHSISSVVALQGLPFPTFCFRRLHFTQMDLLMQY